MGKNKILKFFFLLIFLPFFSSSFTHKNIAQFINDYNTYYFEEPSKYNEFDKFYEGNINKTKTVISYSFNLNITKIVNTTELEKIFFDYQSDYGKLNISFNKGCSNDFIFYASDKNNFFLLDLKDIFNKSDLDDNFVVMEVQVSHENAEADFDFDFSLKVSLKKSINIFEINSEHQILCPTEKVNGDKYRCLFTIVNNNNKNIEDNKKNLLIFPMLNENIDELNLNIYADYINKYIYDNFDKEALQNLIPNENSTYINKINGTKVNFIRIENITYEKYIYISIETNKETLLEILSQEISENQIAYELSDPKKIQTFSINELNSSITLNLSKTAISEMSFLLTTIHGKSTLYFEDDKDKKYTSDIRENNLLLSLDSKEKKLVFDKIDGGHIFYITVIDNKKRVMNELIYGGSSRFSFNKIEDKFIFYENMPISINDSININLQLYNDIETENINDIYKVNVSILTKEEIHEIKYDSSLINNLTFIAEGQIHPFTFSTNIHLNYNLTDKNKTYVLIKLTHNFNVSDKIMILGITLSKVNSLLYPAERIYHYGQLDNHTKVTYKLKGSEKYHLMRLEIGHNTDDIKWSVKRTNDENYTKNDTDLSFVIEYWHNGRELLTIYIENGEDIYLTIFRKSDKKKYGKLLYNYAFKYINSGKNGDFKNYVIKDDYLKYEEKDRNITMKELWNNHPHNFLIKYYMRLIETPNYKIGEELNSISLIESNSLFSLNNTFTTDEDTSEKLVVFNMKNYTDISRSYNINCYIAVIEDNNDIELLSYSETYIEGVKKKQPIKGLIIAALCITGVVFIILVIRFIHHVTCAESYYTKRKKKNSRYHYDYLV